MTETGTRILIMVTRGTMGGAQVSVLNLARSLHEAGENVTVAAGPGHFVASECRKSGIPYQQMEHLRRTLNPLRMLVFVWNMKQVIDREQFDVIHINSSNALFATISARLSRQKPRTVFTFRGLSVLDENYRSAPVRWFFWCVFRFFALFGKLDVPVFVSEANRQTAQDKKLVKNGEVVYNGLDPEKLTFFERETARRELGRHTGRDLTDVFLMGSIGRLAYQKNYEFLIHQIGVLAKQNPSVMVVIIGGGPERDTLERTIDEAGVREHVILAGEHEHASRYMRAFDLFVLPSRYEGLSITLIETLFAGVPVLASNVGGAREQFSHAPFQIYPLNDGDTFRERVERLIDNPEIRSELAEGNKERSDAFTIDRVAREYTELYQTK